VLVQWVPCTDLSRNGGGGQPRPIARQRRVGATWMISRNFFNPPSHKRSGFRSPALARSTIRLVMIPLAKSSASLIRAEQAA
jgi:hypothetical protein